jgi:glycosyltransferase involved in cell wall biosynthesis
VTQPGPRIRLQTVRHSPRLLLLGPTYSIHVRRWAELAREIGFRVFVAGDVPPGTESVDFDGVAENVFYAPYTPYVDPSTRLRPLHRRFRLLRRRFWLRRLVGRLSPDVIHAHWLRTWGWWAADSGSHPLVVTVWGTDVYGVRRWEERPFLHALRRAECVTAPSADLVREMVRLGAPPERVAHVELGVDLAAFRPPSDEERDAAKRRLGLGPEPVVLSFRAGFPVYNLPVIVGAFSRLRRTHPEAQLLVAHGRARISEETDRALRDPALREALRVDGDVPHDRMPDYFKAASVGVSIPSSDGSPRSVWEGLACGLPMVISDLPQVCERLDGCQAALPVPIDEAAVAGAIEKVLMRPELARTMGEAGREWAVENIDHRESVRRLARTYGELIDG